MAEQTNLKDKYMAVKNHWLADDYLKTFSNSVILTEEENKALR